jgi:DNA polymerase-3 subunit beta
MQLNLSRNELQFAAVEVTNVIHPKLVKPILGGVLIRAREGKVQFSATDMESSIQIEWETAIEEEGQVVVDAKTFSEIVSNLNEERIRLELELSSLRIAGGSAHMDLPTMDPESFPPIQLIETGAVFRFSKDLLKSMIQKVIFAASIDDFMKNLNGVLWELNGKYLRLVAADGFRLALAEEPAFESEPIETPVSFLISLKAMKEFLSLLRETEEETIELVYDDRRVGIHLDRIHFTARVLDMDFPDYRKVIPSSFRTKVECDREKLLQQLKLANIITRHSGESVRLEVRQDALKVLAKTSERGAADIEIIVHKDGDDLTAAYNAKFLIDALQQFKEPQIELSFVDRVGPLQMTDLDPQGYLCIVMPVRID